MFGTGQLCTADFCNLLHRMRVLETEYHVFMKLYGR